MSVVAFLLPPQLCRVQQALKGSHDVIQANSWACLELRIRTEPVGVVILDPAVDRDSGVARCETMIQRYTSVPFIAYVGIDARSIQAVARLSRKGLQDILLFDQDDSPECIKGKIDAVSLSPLASVFLGELRPFLSKLPVGIGHSVEDLFQAPQRYRCAQDLAKSASVTMSFLYRSFKTAELSSPKKFLTAARLLRGYKFLLEPQFSVEHVACKTGYPSARAFVRHTREVFGTSPSKLRAKGDHDSALAELHWWLVRNEGAADSRKGSPVLEFVSHNLGARPLKRTASVC